MKMKEWLVNDQGLVLFAQLGCGKRHAKACRPTVLLAEDHDL